MATLPVSGVLVMAVAVMVVVLTVAEVVALKGQSR